MCCKSAAKLKHGDWRVCPSDYLMNGQFQIRDCIFEMLKSVHYIFFLKNMIFTNFVVSKTLKIQNFTSYYLSLKYKMLNMFNYK